MDELGLTAEANPLRHLVERMSSRTEIEPSADLADRIMNAVDRESRMKETPFVQARSPGLKPWFGAAAAAAIVIALFFVRNAVISNLPADSAGTGQEQWLARCQEPDGSWSPARHGGSRVYRPALTALSALALHRAGDAYRDEVRRARDYLQGIQQPDGSFGGEGRERLYNQAITTFVLAETASDGDSLEALRRATALITGSQGAEGGWDYMENSQGNAAITSWQIQALAAVERTFAAASRSSGQNDLSAVNISMKKGLRWLRGMTDEGGRVAYNRGSTQLSETVGALTGHALLTAGAAFPELSEVGHRVVAALGTAQGANEGQDLYRDCMKVCALKVAGETAQADALKSRVAAASADAGGDQWGKVGGKLYVASIRSLTRTF